MKDKYLKLFLNGLDGVIPDDLAAKLQSSKPLRIKYGADPSAPDLHIGHWIGLKKLRYLQLLGHHIIFLIGDFTAKIGDPTGKSETRKPLTDEQVQANTKTYQEQVFRVLDPEKTEVVFNSTWLGKLTSVEMIQLASKTTVARMLERDDFSKRFKDERPIGLHEFLYPLLQGYDSVALKSDLELCGTDQTFNVLMGRQLQKEMGQVPQSIAITPLLEGLDGVQKMSKSLGNYIGITEAPDQMFGKLMSIPDSMLLRYFTLLTDLLPEELVVIQSRLDSGENPKQLKEELAVNIVTQLHTEAAAFEAKEGFNRVFSQRLNPEDIEPLIIPETPFRLDALLVARGVFASKKEVLRLATQNAISLDGEVISDLLTPFSGKADQVLKIGKRKFFKLQIGNA